MNIELINQYLKEGKKVSEIRKILGYSEKIYLKKMGELGYKFDQKLKQYIPNNTIISNIEVSNTTCNTISNTISNDTNLNVIEQEQSIKFIYENIQELQEMIMYYKRNKESNTNNYGIIINLIDDKDIDNGKPVSVRVNKHVWRDWQEFTKDINYSSKELVSMALKEYMEKYK